MVDKRFDNLISRQASHVSSNSPMEYADAEQELRVVAWRVTITYQSSKGPLEAYLYQSLKNKTYNLITQWCTRRAREVEMVKAVSYEQPLIRMSFEADLVNKIYLDELESQLSDPLRCILKNLRLGYSQTETARRVGLSQPRVSQLLEDIRHYACQLEL